ncbi:hypothetical protein CWI80_11945 [Pseudidiomarina sediminum]|uniref:Uncharacterized protein n=1 Tax=Pseudidiomarina sediminum TaxID=431675 RepID=A0A432YZJ3_9GAMM|nr:hypothetical protein [Pseudidiomarina sediminum]MBY6065076.1 hypothetical protein [Pseudidiomarina sediminum]RUO69349.1 hypothetical protein CWI80_11945 [Pseudidiomarina sediminum]
MTTTSGQASVETLVVALSLLTIVLVPVTAEGTTLLAFAFALVQQWMLVFSAFWQHYTLHPWAG